MRVRQTVLWVEPPHIPYPRALIAQGAMLEQLLVVRARSCRAAVVDRAGA